MALAAGAALLARGASTLAVSAGAALSGLTNLAMGNVVGSNRVNVPFIPGLAALITPLAVHRQLVRQDVPTMIGVPMLLVVWSRDRWISLIDGLPLLAPLRCNTTVLVRQSAAQNFAAAMLCFVVPQTVVTLTVGLLKPSSGQKRPNPNGP